MQRSSLLRMLLALALVVGFSSARLYGQQEEEPAETRQYRADYERLQKTVAISDPMARADALLGFIRQRPNSQIIDYAQGNYLHVIEGFAKAEKYPVVVTLSERLIQLRPKVGETYYFYGAALKNQQKFDEAMTALAKCHLLKNSASRKAKEFLDFIYKARNRGSLVGLDAFLKKVEAGLK